MLIQAWEFSEVSTVIMLRVRGTGESEFDFLRGTKRFHSKPRPCRLWSRLTLLSKGSSGFFPRRWSSRNVTLSINFRPIGIESEKRLALIFARSVSKVRKGWSRISTRKPRVKVSDSINSSSLHSRSQLSITQACLEDIYQPRKVFYLIWTNKHAVSHPLSKNGRRMRCCRLLHEELTKVLQVFEFQAPSALMKL
jgi:hypothetical protein